MTGLRDKVAEQASEMAALRQALAEARRGSTAAGATLRDSGADVQALRDQMRSRRRRWQPSARRLLRRGAGHCCWRDAARRAACRRCGTRWRAGAEMTGLRDQGGGAGGGDEPSARRLLRRGAEALLLARRCATWC
nr:unnamed protein product [Leishmania braziliensis]